MNEDKPSGPAAMPPAAERVVLVGGLHRSGTSPLARWLAAHPDVSGLTETGVYEDEGQHLQSVYPPAAAYGGPGRFATHPDARLTEESALVTPDASDRLLEAWLPYWETSKAVLIEKSPPNLIRMRFLRAIFPKARFIIVIRHPIAVALATRKWHRAGVNQLIMYWLAAHCNLVEDARRVGDVALIRYEDLMLDPAAELDRLFAFLSLPSYVEAWPARSGINDTYFSRFASSRWPWRNRSDRRAALGHEGAVAAFGYSLIQPARLGAPAKDIAALRPGPRQVIHAREARSSSAPP